MRHDAFTYLLRVRYGECDAQKVVFNARYGDYVDIAATEYIRAVWGGFDQLLERDIDFQLVRQLLEWKSSARFDEILAIRVETARIGTTSFTLRMEMSILDSGRAVATAETVNVLVSATKHEKKPIDAEYRATLEAGAPGIVVDHAGISAPAGRA